MIRALLFLLTFGLALACKSAGLPLWPVFFALALCVAGAAFAAGRQRDGLAASTIGLGILAMLAPFTGVWSSLYAVALWTVIILALVRWNKWAALFALPMPVGYALLFFFPGDGSIWAIVEISGVIALLASGRGLNEIIQTAGRRLGGLAGIASRVGADAGNRRD